jgi:plastocyanin
MRIVLLGAALVFVVLGMSAGAGERKGPVPSHTVMIEGMKFQPEVLTVASGDTVVWVNADLVDHTATAQDGTFDSKRIEAGKSWSFTVSTPGEIAYVCEYHPSMKGTLNVSK